MMELLVATKVAIPPPRPQMVRRPRLMARLNAGLHGKAILVAAPAGFGKTTLLSEWLGDSHLPAARLSLEAAESDPMRFLAYLVAALQTMAADFGHEIAGALQSPQPPPLEALLTILVNAIVDTQQSFILVLDDYHVIQSEMVDHALTFLLDHLPPQMHLVIATREEPRLPLAKLRARGQLTELHAADLRFTTAEAAEFLNRLMHLRLSAADIAALETRTEGWIAGLQLAALSLQRHPDVAGFIKAFSGNHHFVLDYLAEEVLQQQPAAIQAFLLRTSILDRMCGPLCDAVVSAATPSGQATLEYLERANLFIVPLDDERRWYRYHHLFADLLRQRLRQRLASSPADDAMSEAALHARASEWFEANGLDIEAFQHAAAAHDIERAERLIEGHGMPLQFRGAVVPVLNWLAAQPSAILDAHPTLWVMYASALSISSQLGDVEAKLQAGEAALRCAPPDAKTRNLIGHIAAIRALLAAAQGQGDAIIAQSHRALEYLHPDNVPVRTATIWKLGYAYQLRGDFAAASRAYREAMSLSQASGNTIIYLSAAACLGQVQEAENQFAQAEQTYQHVLQQAGDLPSPLVCEARLGLARVYAAWHDDAAAQRYARLSADLAATLRDTDRLMAAQTLLAQMKHVAKNADATTGNFAHDQTLENAFAPQPLIAPLSQRETEILRLIAQGLSNQAICARLFLALDTVKGHNRKIFGKLQVQRRTEAVARARELGLL